MADNEDESFELVDDDGSDLFLNQICSKNLKKKKNDSSDQWIGDDCSRPSTSGGGYGRRQRELRKRDSNYTLPIKNTKKIRLDLSESNTKGIQIDTPVHQLLNSAAKLDNCKCPLKNWLVDDDEEDDIQYINRLTNRCPLDSWRDIDHSDSEAEDADASGQSTTDGVRTLSDSEVDRDRKAPVKRQRSSRTIVLSDSESELPCPRIKKSPRCQIFPRQPFNSNTSPRANMSPRNRPRVPILVGGMKLDVDVNEQNVERMQLNSVPRRATSISPIAFPDEEVDIEIDSEPEFMDPVQQVQQMEDDENLARRLQAEYDAEIQSAAPLTTQISPRLHVHPHSNHRQFRARRIPTNQPDRRISATFRVNNGMENPVTALPLRIELRPTPQGTRVAFQRPSRVARGGRWDAWNLLFTDIDDDYEGLLDLADLMGEVRKRGLSEAEIGQLPTRTVLREQTLKRTPSGTRTRCHICMCDYEDGEEMRSLTCFHEFHSACIDRWLRENATCPICRAEVKLTTEQN